jgi:DNA ligase-associated metallophosphoesterase
LLVLFMRALSSGPTLVAENVLLDGRLGLFHERDKWLAVADLHFGYELSQRAAGNLFPLWGMQSVRERLDDLLGDYQPARLILLGDLVHDKAAGREFARLVEDLRSKTEVILIAGNHDRGLRHVDLVESWTSNGFFFHHGHCESELADCVQIIGHHHPAGVVRDGAGLSLKLPAFVQQQDCWIMPAFSPWAGGTEWRSDDEDAQLWLCSPERILKLDISRSAS